MGEGNLDQLCSGAVLDNLLNIKEERAEGSGSGRRGNLSRGLDWKSSGGTVVPL